MMTSAPAFARVGDRANACATAMAAALLAAVLATPALGRAAVLSEDPGDQTYLTIAINEALETRKTEVEVALRNPDTGSHGILVIERTYYRDPTTPCRDYRRTIQRASAPPTEVRGTGCRIGKALWSLDEVSVPPAARPTGSSRGDAPLPLSPRTASPAAKPGGAAPGATGGAAEGRTAAPAPASADTMPAPPPFPNYTMPTRSVL